MSGRATVLSKIKSLRFFFKFCSKFNSNPTTPRLFLFHNSIFGVHIYPTTPTPTPDHPCPSFDFTPFFFNCTCTMTGFHDSYLADLDPAFSKFHIYINSWSASTRPSPTPGLLFYITLTSILGSHSRLHFIICYLQCSLYIIYYFNTAILYFYIRHPSPALYH